MLVDSAKAIKDAVDLPIQGQCEPPDDFRWFARMRDAGVDALGMHLEAVQPDVRARIMPGKAARTHRLLLQSLRSSSRRVWPRAGQHLHPRRPRRFIRRHSSHVRRSDRDGCLSVRSPLRPHFRHPAGISPRPDGAKPCEHSCANSAACSPAHNYSHATSKQAAANAGACSSLSAYEDAANLQPAEANS